MGHSTCALRCSRLVTLCKVRLNMGGSPGDVGEATEGLENELRWSNGRVGEWAVTKVKQRKGCRMSCDVSKAMEGLENELCHHLPTSQLILQPFRCFTYITVHSPTLPSRCFTYVTGTSPTSPGEPSMRLNQNLLFIWSKRSSLLKPEDPPYF